MAEQSVNFKFLVGADSRQLVRTSALIVYFVLFQILILLQKPFLQVDFIFSFYLAFIGLFAHHLYMHVAEVKEKSSLLTLASYAFDFVILSLFMKSFPQLSSFLLVIQLFLLFLASFDLAFIQLCSLGLMASFGVSVMNLSMVQSGSIQNILSLALFNLSYLVVIIVSKQLKTEIYGIQSDLSRVQKKSKSQAEFAKVLLEKIPLGLVVTQNNNNENILMQNSFITENLKLSNTQVQQLIQKAQSTRAFTDVAFVSDAASEAQVFQYDQVGYFDEEMNAQLTVSLIKDVTEMRQLENQLKQKEKLAAIGQLAAGIAHEIRNPLAGISGSVQMLSADGFDPDQIKLMKIILKEIDRLNNLITEFLDYAKPEKKPDQEILLSQVLDEVIQNVKNNPTFSKSTEWFIQLNSQKILGFTEKLKQAFLNIVINAIQAMDQMPTAKVEVRMFDDSDFVCVSIKDFGYGMKPETKKRLFEPFHTTKIKGTGLGLAVTHKILESHGARIDVLSEEGKGTEFIIKFPKLGFSKKEDTL